MLACNVDDILHLEVGIFNLAKENMVWEWKTTCRIYEVSHKGMFIEVKGIYPSRSM